MKELISKVFNDCISIIKDNVIGIYSFISMGRNATAKEVCEYATYSAVLDNRCCNDCSNLNGTRFKVDSPEYYDNMPPLHNRCRCVYIYEIMEKGEE